MKRQSFVNFAKAVLLLYLCSVMLAACGYPTVTPKAKPEATSTATLPPAPTPVSQPLPLATPTPVPPTPVPLPKGELNIWEQLAPEQATILRNKLATFQKIYPDVLFNLRHIEPESFSEALLAAGKQGPHLFLGPAAQAGEWQRAGLVLPLDALFDRKLFDLYEPAPLQGLTLNGKLWGLPFNYGRTLLLYYNLKLAGPDKVPDNWDALTAYVRANPSRKDEFYPFAANLNDPNLLLAVPGAFGGTPFDRNSRPNFNTEAMQQALQFLQDNVFRYKTVPFTPDYAQLLNLFKAGKVAFIIGNEENLAEFRQSGIEVGVARLPKLNDKFLTPPLTGALAYFVGRTAQDDPEKLAAVRLFLSYISQPEQQKDLITQLKLLPATRAGITDPAVRSDPALAAVAEQAQNSMAIPPLPEWKVILEAMRGPIANVVAARASAAEGAAAIQELALRAGKR